MSFKPNNCQQLTFHDTFWGTYQQRKTYARKILGETIFREDLSAHRLVQIFVLYSDKASRPNTPVNVSVGALIIEELFDMIDDEIAEALMFDIRYQYALHTTSFKEQPLSDKTLTLFLRRCYQYEMADGTDLIHDTKVE